MRRALLAAATALTLGLVGLVVLPAPAMALTAPVLSSGTITSTSIQLNWTDAVDETSYEVHEQTAACTGGGAAVVLPANTLTYTVSNLLPNTTHTFCVWTQWRAAGMDAAGSISLIP